MGLNIKEQDRILVVAPHPDDESIGCGGLLSMYGNQCDVLLITDGDTRKIVSDIADIREKEFIAAVTWAGVNDYKCLRIPEHQIKSSINIIAQIDFKKYVHVFVPNRYEAHDDHIAVYKAIKMFVRKTAKLYEYEVSVPLRKPNVYLDITKVSESKINLIKFHESQIKCLDYVGMIMGLNAYRGRSHGYLYAECYYCAEEKKQQNIRRMKRKIKSIIKN